jgi:hypothetical protein
MELTSDTKYLVAEKLTGKELIKLCSSDPDMRRLFLQDKYNHLWQSKLKEEYNVDYEGVDGYMEYLQHTYFYNKKRYVASKFHAGDCLKCFIFNDIDDTINWIYSDIFYKLRENNAIPSFPIVYSRLKETYEYTIGNFNYVIAESKITFDEDSLNFIDLYKKKLKEIGVVVSKGDPSADLSSEYFVDDFIDGYGGNYEKTIEELKNDYNVEKGRDMIEGLIVDSEFILK